MSNVCPLCLGRGSFRDPDRWFWQLWKRIPCHCCNGTGMRPRRNAAKEPVSEFPYLISGNDLASLERVLSRLFARMGHYAETANPSWQGDQREVAKILATVRSTSSTCSSCCDCSPRARFSIHDLKTGQTIQDWTDADVKWQEFPQDIKAAIRERLDQMEES